MGLITKDIMTLAFLAACAVSDLRERRIPNCLAACGVFTGLYFSGSAEALAWGLASLGVLFAVGAFGAIGMGDLKMWMAVACLSGFLFSCAAVSCGIGFLLLSLALRGDTETLREAVAPFKRLGRRGPEGKDGSKASEPFAPYLLIGAALCAAARTLFCPGLP